MSSSETPSFDNGALLQLLEIARQLAAPISLDALLQQVIDAGRAVLGADRGSVFLFDAVNNELFSTVATGTQQIRFSVALGIAGECARTRHTIHVPDCYADPRFNQAVDKRTGYRTRNMITLPLVGLDDDLVGVLQLLNTPKSTFDAADQQLSHILASQAAAAIQRAQLIDSREVKLKLERDLALAKQIQLAVIPQILPDFPGYDIASFSRPADETGGDIYDVIKLPLVGSQDSIFGQPLPPDGIEKISQPTNPNAALEGGVIFMADATGHGIGPALSVTQVRAMLRLGLRVGTGIDQIMYQINDQLCDDMGGKRFVTAFLGFLDWSKHQIRYHSAGQGPLLHFRARDQHFHWMGASTMPLGVMPGLQMDVVQPLDMQPGDMLVLLTDGFYEFANKDGELMGKERIGAALLGALGSSSEKIIDAILKATLEFADGNTQADDLTAVIIQRKNSF